MYSKYRILHDWSFPMKFMKQAFGDSKILFIIWPFKIGFYHVQINSISIKNRIVNTNVVSDITPIRDILYRHKISNAPIKKSYMLYNYMSYNLLLNLTSKISYTIFKIAEWLTIAYPN